MAALSDLDTCLAAADVVVVNAGSSAGREDYTRAIFAEDPTVHTFSLHNRTLLELPAVADTCLALGADISDQQLLEAVREQIAMAAPLAVFTVVVDRMVVAACCLKHLEVGVCHRARGPDPRRPGRIGAARRRD